MAATRTPEQIVTEALGTHIDYLNWCMPNPWAFDDTVFEAADRIAHTLTSEEMERMREHVTPSSEYYMTITALERRPGDLKDVTAQIIATMYSRVSNGDIDDEDDGDDSLVTDPASLAEIEHGRRHEMY